LGIIHSLFGHNLYASLIIDYRLFHVNTPSSFTHGDLGLAGSVKLWMVVQRWLFSSIPADDGSDGSLSGQFPRIPEP
jgi:hypothetical protein